MEKTCPHFRLPEAGQPLILDHRWGCPESLCKIRGQSKRIARCRQHGIERLAIGMAERGCKPAKRAEAGTGHVVEHRQAAPLPPGYHQQFHLGRQRCRHMANERLPIHLVQRLVRSEAARAAAGKNDAQEPQAVSSKSSRPIRKRRISEVPAPISYSFASRNSRPVG